jgi:flagellar biosynthetic protein FliP
MLKQTQADDLALFEKGSTKLTSPAALPMAAVVPAFALSEMRAAFIIGFVIFVPFLVIDLVVSSTLMSLGMMMLPPSLVSLPFKLLLFVLVDGWALVVQSLLASFH